MTTRPLKLTDIQLVLLAAAGQREGGSLLPPPVSIADQVERSRKAVTSLIKRKLAVETSSATPDLSWRSEDERHIGVVITDAGRAAIASENEYARLRAISPGLEVASSGASAEQTAPEAAPAPAPAAPRRGSKLGHVLALLQRTQGATLEELVVATGWLPHTTRAALTGLRKRGHNIGRAKRNDVTCYHAALAA